MVELEELYARVVGAFANLEEVQEILVFGSLAEKQYDAYSDIDLHVVTCDFELTVGQFRSVFEAISPILMQYLLSVRPGYVSYTVMLQDYPLYNKLDISILDPAATILFPGAVSIFQRAVVVPYRRSQLLATTIEAGPLRTVQGHVLGAVRYAKYRKRGCHFSAYKFYRAQCEWYFLQVYRRGGGDVERTAMGSLEYRVLDGLADHERLARYLYPADQAAMDMLYLELLGEELVEMSGIMGEGEREVLGKIVEFVRGELMDVF